METEVQKTQEVTAPVALKTEVEGLANLESAIQNAFAQIKHCDEQAAMWLKRKEEYQTMINETFGRVQKQFGVVAEPKKRVKVDKDGTVPDLIRSYLEKNGPARTKDIRKFLLAQGRKTNPGVALSRMCKDGTLKNMERGVYKVVV